jgi:hypothetical protein
VKSRQPSRRRWSYRPELIALEDRVMLSVTSTVFALDQNVSSLTLSGTVGSATIQQQGAGSLVTKYMGSLVAQWDLDGHTINFVAAGTAATALNSGNWQPLPGGASGSAPANYGARATVIIVTANAAVRDLVATLSTSSPLALTGSGPSYSYPSTQTMTITNGFADYNAGSFGTGRSNLANNSATNTAAAGTFQDLGNGAYRLTVPINTTINSTVAGMQATLHIIGTIVANATIPVVNLSSSSVPGNYATQVVATHGPVHITDPAARVTDAAAGNLASMTATLTNHPDGTQERLAVDLSGTGLSGSYNSATGVETITGSAAPAVYTTALERLTYQNDALTPNTADRVIQVVASDGTNASVVRTSTVTVFAPATTLAVTNFPSPTTAGTAGTFTVTAKDANGSTAPGYTGIVAFSSSDGQAVPGNGLPTNYTFVAGDHGVHTFSATLKTAAPQSITATDTTTTSITGTQSGIVVNPAAPDHFALATSASNPDIAGTTFDVTVTVQDAYSNTVTGYTGTVQFSSMDPYVTGATLPPPYAFTLTDAGVHTFSAGAILYTAGTWDVTAIDTGLGITGSANVNVVAGSAIAFQLLVPMSASSGSAFDVTVIAVDAYGNTDHNYTGTVTFTTSDLDPQVVLPPPYTFQVSDGGVALFPGGVTLFTTGSPTLTVTDANGFTGSVTIMIT